MYTIGTSCRRRGTSTIMGTLIFVGIIFTAVIPMMLVVKQADTLYEMRKHELVSLDEERAMESIFFHLETSIDSETEEPIITLVFYNRGVMAVKIVHVWINGGLREVNYLILPTSNEEFELRNLIDPPYEDTVSFSIMVVTDNGNIFLPPSGNPEYSFIDEVGSWEYHVYTIYIMMTHKRPQLHALITCTTEVPNVIVFNDNLENNLDGYLIGVTFDGKYLVIVTQFYDIELRRVEVTLNPNSPAVLVII